MKIENGDEINASKVFIFVSSCVTYLDTHKNRVRTKMLYCLINRSEQRCCTVLERMLEILSLKTSSFQNLMGNGTDNTYWWLIDLNQYFKGLRVLKEENLSWVWMPLRGVSSWLSSWKKRNQNATFFLLWEGCDQAVPTRA